LAVLSDKEILAALERGILKIIPFSKERLNPAGYDFASDAVVHFAPKDHKLVLSSESIELSAQILATIHLKSSFREKE
jgi:deoxycytidine triphosphate deaminase